MCVVCRKKQLAKIEHTEILSCKKRALRTGFHYNIHLCSRSLWVLVLTDFFQFEALEVFGDSSLFSVFSNTGGSHNPCIFWGGEKKRKKQQKSQQHSCLATWVAMIIVCTSSSLNRVHLKVFVQLFIANLNFVLTQEITSPFVITVHQKHLRLSDSKDSPSVVQKTICLGTRPW